MITREEIVNRLNQFGYTTTEEDHSLLDFELEKTINYVKNFCNITIIPEILKHRIIDRVCCYVLYNKKNTGNLTGFNYDVVIKQIKEGDTTIQYAVGQGEDTPENRFDAFVTSLERGFDKWLTPHRRIRW